MNTPQPTELDLLRAALSFQNYWDATPLVSPGQGPQRCPSPLPALDGVIGTVEFGEGEEYMAQIYFHALPLEEAEAHMQEVYARLGDLGWRVPSPQALISVTNGFLAYVPKPPSSDAVLEEMSPFTYLHDKGKVATTWETRSAGEGRLAFKLNIQAGMAYTHYAQQQLPTGPRLPMLLPPAGLSVTPLSIGGNGGTWGSIFSTYALVTAAENAAQIAGGYAAQLRQLGWPQREEVSSQTLHLSAWRTPEGDRALLTVEEAQEKGWQVGLAVTHLEKTQPDGHFGSSWYTI